MRITITPKEFAAIDFAAEQIREDLQSGDFEEEWVELANENLSHLMTVCFKFKDARRKATELNEARQLVRSRNHWMPSAQVDKLARALMARVKEEAKRRERK